ncbi:MAG: GNAT family N-acetyltransferase [Anaerovoracaceae bacterium]
MALRFLKQNEYPHTIPLFKECFGDDPEFLKEYYGQEDGGSAPLLHPQGRVYRNRIAAEVDDASGEIRSMVHVQPMNAVYPQGKEPVSYLLCVATLPSCRGQGCMDRVMRMVMEQLRREGESWCFLVAVDKEIYRYLGFELEWTFRPEEAELLAADEGLTRCSAAWLQQKDASWHPPRSLELRAAD